MTALAMRMSTHLTSFLPPHFCSVIKQVVELSVEDLHPDQVVLLTRTAVLVGIHGAALTNQMWMRPHRGAVVEFGAGGNFHYHNMAAELGHKHFRLDAPDVDALTKAVHQAMDHVSSRYR